MSLPSLAAIPSLLLPLASRAEQSWRSAVAGLEGELGLDEWSSERWSDFARVSAASDFFIEQVLRDPLMLLELVTWGELDRSFAQGLPPRTHATGGHPARNDLRTGPLVLS